MTDHPNHPPIARVVDLGPCDACGQVHTHCRGHIVYERDPVTRERILDEAGNPIPARDENDLPIPCRGKAMIGQAVCRVHGGTLPQALARVERERLDAEAQEAIERARNALGARDSAPITDPASELAVLAGEIRATQRAAADLVAGLNDEGSGDDILIATFGGGLDVHPLVKLLERFTDRSARVLTDMAKLGLAEHMAAVQAGQVDVLDRALRAVLERQGVEADSVLRDLAVELRAMDAVNETPPIEVGGAEADPT